MVYVNPLKIKAKQFLRKGDILLTASTGSIKVIGKNTFCEKDYEASFGAFCKVIRPKNINHHYLKHMFQSPQYFGYIQNIVNGANINNIKNEHLDNFKIPLPPLTTQKRIAQILDNAAALRDKTQQLLTEYDQLAQSIFLEMFGDPVINPMGWEMGFLADYTKKITDGTHHSPKMSESGYPYVTAKHIKEMYLDFDSNPTFVSQDAHNEIYNRCKPELNDVLLIKDGATTGIACLNSFEEPISLLSSVGLIKPNYERLNPFFIAFWFNHSGVKQNLIRKYMSGAAIKRYTISKIKKFHLMIPPIHLQNQFAEKIALIEQQKALAKQELQQSENLFNCLLQKAFKGELG